MKCTDCQYFKILYRPLKAYGGIYDTGRAVCTKHDYVLDFVSTQQVNRQMCVDRKKGR